MKDATRQEAIQWCRDKMADFHTPVFPTPEGWLWAESGNQLVLQPIFTMTDQGDEITAAEVGMQQAGHAGREQGNGSEHCRAESQPEETVDAEAWIEVLELPEGFRIAEHLPGIWEYQFDIEDEADEDSDCTVSGTSWNHPALAAIAAWSHAYDTLAQQPAACTACNDLREVGGATPEGFETHPCPECAQQPAAVDGAMVERATMELLGKTHDTAPGVDWRCDRSWTVNRVRELMRRALTAALAQQSGGSDNG